MGLKTLNHTKIIELSGDFSGYLSLEGSGIWISSIESVNKGRGNFSRLIEELKRKYDFIKVPTPSNAMMAILIRKGFILKEEWFSEPFNEMGEILVWRKA